MTTVYLIRHAEAEGNLFHRAHGRYNGGITERGYDQIAALSRRFAGTRIDAVYASDLLRARVTALALAQPRALPIISWAALREVSLGAWEDRPWAELKFLHAEQYDRYFHRSALWDVPGAERVADARARMADALRAIVAARPDQTVAVVSHGNALRQLTGALRGLSDEALDRAAEGRNTAVTKLEADADGIRVVFRDDASHLPTDAARRAAPRKAGVYFRSADGDGAFDALREGETVGWLRVACGRDGAAEIAACALDGRPSCYSARFVGQAVSHMRAQGCDTLRLRLRKDDAAGLTRAARHGFVPAEAESAQSVLLERYFGLDEARCARTAIERIGRA